MSNILKSMFDLVEKNGILKYTNAEIVNLQKSLTENKYFVECQLLKCKIPRCGHLSLIPNFLNGLDDKYLSLYISTREHLNDLEKTYTKYDLILINGASAFNSDNEIFKIVRNNIHNRTIVCLVD